MANLTNVCEVKRISQEGKKETRMSSTKNDMKLFDQTKKFRRPNVLICACLYKAISKLYLEVPG